MRKITLLALLLSILCLGAGTTVVGAADEDLEYKVKAAFLLNFAKFTTWPEDFWPAGKAVFLISIIGNDPFGPALGGVEEKQIGGKYIRVNYAAAASSGLDQCQLLFVSKSEKERLERIIKDTGNKPIVTVSDIEGFAAAGGIFEFKSNNGRLSFIINNSRAKENGIHISSLLLKLAIEVL